MIFNTKLVNLAQALGMTAISLKWCTLPHQTIAVFQRLSRWFGTPQKLHFLKNAKNFYIFRYFHDMILSFNLHPVVFVIPPQLLYLHL